MSILAATMMMVMISYQEQEPWEYARIGDTPLAFLHEHCSPIETTHSSVFELQSFTALQIAPKYTHHTHCIITALLLLLHYRQLQHHDEIPKSNAPMYVHRSKESLHSIRNGGRVVFGGFGLCGTGTPLSLAVCRNRANPWDAIHGSARVFQRK